MMTSTFNRLCMASVFASVFSAAFAGGDATSYANADFAISSQGQDLVVIPTTTIDFLNDTYGGYSYYQYATSDNWTFDNAKSMAQAFGPNGFAGSYSSATTTFEIYNPAEIDENITFDVNLYALTTADSSGPTTDYGNAEADAYFDAYQVTSAPPGRLTPGYSLIGELSAVSDSASFGDSYTKSTGTVFGDSDTYYSGIIPYQTYVGSWASATDDWTITVGAGSSIVINTYASGFDEALSHDTASTPSPAAILPFLGGLVKFARRKRKAI